jgi:hypothetical protein
LIFRVVFLLSAPQATCNNGNSKVNHNKNFKVKIRRFQAVCATFRNPKGDNCGLHVRVEMKMADRTPNRIYKIVSGKVAGGRALRVGFVSTVRV